MSCDEIIKATAPILGIDLGRARPENWMPSLSDTCEVKGTNRPTENCFFLPVGENA